MLLDASLRSDYMILLVKKSFTSKSAGVACKLIFSNLFYLLDKIKTTCLRLNEKYLQ